MSAPSFYRRAVGSRSGPAAPLYPTAGLTLWADTSFGPAAVTRNSQGQVLAFKNQVAGGPDLLASAPLDYVNDNGSGLISLVNGDLTATWPQAQQSPVTYIVVLKALPNTPYIQYQIPAELSNPATGDITRVFIKETKKLLIWDGAGYYDIGGGEGAWHENAYALMGMRTSDQNIGEVTVYPPGQGGTAPNFFVNRTYTQARSLAGNYGVKLWLVYNHQLSAAELDAIAATARQRFAF